MGHTPDPSMVIRELKGLPSTNRRVNVAMLAMLATKEAYREA
jgi:hypothetical protein